MSEKKPEARDACEHGIPNPSWRFWTYDTKMELREPTCRIALIDSRDCPQCLRARIEKLRWAFQELLCAFTPEDGSRVQPNRKKFDAAYNAFNDDFRKWGP